MDRDSQTLNYNDIIDQILKDLDNEDYSRVNYVVVIQDISF
jgi:hypothetical protein